MSDIEKRVAEIFREKVASPMRVITLDVVRATMEQGGTLGLDFGEPATRRPQDGRGPRPRVLRTGAPSSTARARTARSPASAAGWPPFSTPTRR